MASWHPFPLPPSRILAADGAEVLLREHGNFMGNRTKRMLGVLGKSPSMSENLGYTKTKQGTEIYITKK